LSGTEKWFEPVVPSHAGPRKIVSSQGVRNFAQLLAVEGKKLPPPGGARENRRMKKIGTWGKSRANQKWSRGTIIHGREKIGVDEGTLRAFMWVEGEK